MSRYIIDKTKLIENIEMLKQKAGVPIIGVVKGNGYGFGIKEFTSVLKECGIKTFAVTVKERGSLHSEECLYYSLSFQSGSLYP